MSETSEFVKAMDKFFAFKVGDYVQMKGTVPGELRESMVTATLYATNDMTGVKAIVMERFAQQCHMDVQRLYRLCWVRADGNVTKEQFNLPEPMLEAAKSWRDMLDAK